MTERVKLISPKTEVEACIDDQRFNLFLLTSRMSECYLLLTISNNMFLFSGNPFDCNCEVMWFREWLLSKGQNVVNLPKETRCNTPEEHAQKPIVKLNNNSFVCSCGNSVSSKLTNNIGTFSIFFLSVFMFFMSR